MKKLTVLLALVLVITGCGGSSDTSTSTTVVEPTAAAVATTTVEVLAAAAVPTTTVEVLAAAAVPTTSAGYDEAIGPAEVSAIGAPPLGWDPSVLANTPGPVTQCLDAGLPRGRVAALAGGEVWPTGEDSPVIKRCLALDQDGPSGDDRADDNRPSGDSGPPVNDDWPCLGNPLTLTYTDFGWPITYNTLGLPAGLTPLVDGMDQGIKFIADPTSVLLADNHVRLFFEGDGDKAWRSTAPAAPPFGLMDFEPEAEYQLLGEDGQARHDLAWRRIFPLSDGRYRMFARSTSTIFSFISLDGLEFIQEAGTRLTLDDLDMSTFRGFEVGFAGYDVVAIDGGWRMYVDYQLGFGPGGASPSNEDRDDFTSRIHSARSPDMLIWTVESGERVGATSSVRGFSEGDRDRGDGGPLRPAARISISSVERLPAGGFLLVFTIGDESCSVTSPDGLEFAEWASATARGVGHQDKLSLGGGEFLVFGTSSEFGIPMGHLRFD